MLLVLQPASETYTRPKASFRKSASASVSSVSSMRETSQSKREIGTTKTRFQPLYREKRFEYGYSSRYR